MDRLAPETLHNVVRYCDLPSQKQLRFVCHALSDIASEYVFKTVFLALLRISLDRVLKIANHPKFSRHVRTLILCPQLLPLYETVKRWESNLNSRPYPKCHREDGVVFADPAIFVEMIQTTDLSDWAKWSFEDNEGNSISIEEWIELPDRTLTFEQTLEGFNQYEEMYDEQSSWLVSGFTPEMKNLFRKLPNLENIELPGSGELRCLPHWRNLRPELLQSPGEWVDSWKEIEGDISGWGVEQLTSCLEAAAAEGRALKKLRFDVDADAFLSNTQSSRYVPPRCGSKEACIARMMGAFAHLRSLDVDFCRNHAEADKIVAQRFASILGGAKQLETLKLVLTQSICDDEILTSDVDFLGHLKHIHLPKLKSLSMSNIRTNEENLLGVLSTHAKTLKSLSLRRINLKYGEGTWTSVIMQLPVILSLNSVILGSLGEIAKPHASCHHVEHFYHLYDCDGPGWMDYYAMVEMWVLKECDLDEDDFPILSGHEWDWLFPENPVLTLDGIDSLDSDEELSGEDD